MLPELMEKQPQQDLCPTCSQRISGRWEALSRGLCASLIKFYHRAGETPLHLQQSDIFTKNEYCNFSKLKYFGLVSKTGKAGYWQVTRTGSLFLLNSFSISRKVFVSSNRVTGHSAEKVTLRDVLSDKEIPYWLKKDDFIRQTSQAEQASLF